MSQDATRNRSRVLLVAMIVVVVALTACAGSGTVSAAPSAQATVSGSFSPQPRVKKPHSYVALGDSWAYGGHCGNCKTFVGRYADKLNQRSGHRVVLTNLTVNGGTSGTTLASLRHDRGVRTAIAGADIIVIETGVNDLDERGTLDAVAAGTCGGRDGAQCLRAVARGWRTNFEAIAEEIDHLRRGKPTALRLVTSQNVFLSDPGIITEYGLPADFAMTGGKFLTEELRDAICHTARRHHGRCVDVGLLFNGPRGDMPRDENTEQSHEQVARALMKTGLAELR